MIVNNTNFPLISVLIPAYNAEKFIRQSIDSILNQTYKNIEVIIIDDASTDGTWKIIQEYSNKDKRIKAYRNRYNIYIAANRNKLLKLAKGKYIAWQDADDISMPNRLEHQYRYLEKHLEVGILGGYLKIFNVSNQNIGIRKYSENDAELRKKIFRYSPIAQPTAMIRKSVIDEIGYYNLKYPPAEDIDMSFRIGRKYKFANLQEITLKYREDNNSATFKRLKKIELTTLTVRFINSKKGYNMTLIDKLLTYLQFISIFIIPTFIKIKLFDLLRNSH